ncbi:MAG: riboflavin synthase [bacterium]
MFTGLIEEIGKVDLVQRRKGTLRLGIVSPHIAADLKVGDSVAISGVCITVVSCDAHRFECDIMEETVRKTTLGNPQAGDLVNLERALPAGGRFGGHFVQGHVDGLGTVRRVLSGESERKFEVLLPQELAKYVVSTGSIAIDGVSLTVARVDGLRVTIALIPHTWENTTLGKLRAGAKVNIEVDIIGKYVEKLLPRT